MLKSGCVAKDMINHELLGLFRQDKMVHDATASGQTGWSGAGMHGGSRLGANLPLLDLESNFIIYRYLGHPELVCDRSFRGQDEVDVSQADEVWQLARNSGPGGVCREAVRDECYFCENYKYVQIYYSRKDRHKAYEKIADPALRTYLSKLLSSRVSEEAFPLPGSACSSNVGTSVGQRSSAGLGDHA